MKTAQFGLAPQMLKTSTKQVSITLLNGINYEHEVELGMRGKANWLKTLSATCMQNESGPRIDLLQNVKRRLRNQKECWEQ